MGKWSPSVQKAVQYLHVTAFTKISPTHTLKPPTHQGSSAVWRWAPALSAHRHGGIWTACSLSVAETTRRGGSGCRAQHDVRDAPHATADDCPTAGRLSGSRLGPFLGGWSSSICGMPSGDPHRSIDGTSASRRNLRRPPEAERACVSIITISGQVRCVGTESETRRRCWRLSNASPHSARRR